MLNATITSKGQITIPVEIRRALKLSAGDKIGFEEIQPGEFALKSVETTSASALKGMFGTARKRVSIAQMNAAIAARAAAAK
jgi:antitoxin PrlF